MKCEYKEYFSKEQTYKARAKVNRIFRIQKNAAELGQIRYNNLEYRKEEMLLPRPLADTLHSIVDADPSLDFESFCCMLGFLSYLLLEKPLKSNYSITDYTPIPATFIRTKGVNEYGPWLNALKEHGILDCNESYRPGLKLPSNPSKKIGGYCRKYRLNLKYLLMFNLEEDNMVRCEYYTFKPAKFRTDKNKKVKFNRNPKLEAEVRKNIDYLDIDQKGLEQLMRKLIADVSILDFKVNEQITGEVLEITPKSSDPSKRYGKKYRINREKALKECVLHNRSLIQDGDTIVLQNEQEFLREKRCFMYASYLNSIHRLANKYTFSHRNSTNNRMDHNLTNFPNELLKKIMVDNQLVQLDLRNSQFAILGHILKPHISEDKPDIKIFTELASKGKLYEYIMEQLNYSKRSEAKSATMSLFFSSRKNKSQKVKDLKKIMPNVVEFINDYKKEHGDKAFSIMLQRKESEIFIDGILKRALTLGYFCIPKHDSLLIRKQDKEDIRKIMEDYFKEIFFEGVLGD